MSSDTVWRFEGIFLENFFSLTHYITAHSGSDVEQQVRNAMRRSATELIVEFIIAAVCLSATLASNASMEDKNTCRQLRTPPHLPRGNHAVPQWERLHFFP